MARQERPVDPADGPLQSMAYDLRKLRGESGAPTYRELARKTGYSPSTLSEAAGGRRRPTLDVLLAYVGALGGDLDEWRDRWTALDGPAEPAPVVTGPKRAWSPRIVLTAAMAVTLAAAGAFWLARPTPGAVVPPGCPELRDTAKFTARTYGSGATVREGPARIHRPLRNVPPGCTVGLTGYCVGEVITDETAHTPDVRWFQVDGGGVLASAIVHGNPPPDMPPSRCPGDRPAPSSITLAAARTADVITLTATGRDVEVIGYAAFYADSPGAAATWHQIGLTGRLPLTWHPGILPAGAKPVLAAAACLGGESPTGVVDLDPGDAGLTADQRTAAAQVACLYPVAKLPTTVR